MLLSVPIESHFTREQIGLIDFNHPLNQTKSNPIEVQLKERFKDSKQNLNFVQDMSIEYF